MTDQWDAHFFRLPAGASKRDRQVGYTEFGQPLYEAPNGTRYSFDGSLNATREAQPSSPNMLVNRTLPDGRVYHDYAPRQNQNALAATDIIGGLAQSIANPFLAPGRALRGEPVTYGDVFELAAMTNLGASMFGAPKGALRSGAMRIDASDAVTPAQAQADDIMRLLREGRGADVTDDMMAAADQAYLSRIYDLPLDDASRMARAKSMYMDAAREASEDYWDSYGLRTDLDPSHATAPSREWLEGELTGEILDGTSITDFNLMRGREDLGFAMHGLPAEGVRLPWGSVNYTKDLGDDTRQFLSLVAGSRNSYGIDEYESVVGDAVSYLTRNRLTARFDPRLSHLRNLSAGVGGAAVGLNALAPQQADAQEIIDYLSRQK